MRFEPPIKRTAVFIDGQNLFYSVCEAFGYTFPNYDVSRLAEEICRNNGWQVLSVNFYTGVPSAKDDPFWNSFWQNKLKIMGKRGINVYSRYIKYREKAFNCPNCGIDFPVRFGQEKGIDLRLAIDAIRMARNNEYDVCIIFSQDQDFTELVKELKSISMDEDKWLRVVCAYPVSQKKTNTQGIHGTQSIEIDKKLYDLCIDPLDYRPKLTPPV
ncbi:MAG: NYN domain-containing protein [bacterium]|nr:NYN domain-containing protein [bacterium]